MKSKLKYIIGILILLISTPVFAADISTSLSGKGTINAGEQFTITLNVNGQNVWGLSGSIGYDKSKLNLVSSSGLNGFTSMIGTGFSLDSASGKSGSFGILSLKFKATKTFLPGESTTITFSNLTGASDSSRLSVSGCKKTIKVNVPKSKNANLSNLKVDGNTVSNFSSSGLKYDLGTTEKSQIQIDATAQDSKAIISGTGKKTLKYGTNTFKVVVKAENGTTKTYVININKKDNRSKNNYLKTLSVTNAKINFNKSTLNYTVIVDNKVDSINIKATAEDGKSTITGTGTKQLKVYLNTFNIVVKAENGSTRTYKLNISRKDKDGNAGKLSTNNELKKLEIKGYKFNFNPKTEKYSISVDNTVEKIEISAVVSDNTASVKINNPEKLIVGENLITVEVTSQSGKVKTYKITVTRKDNIPVVSIKDIVDTIGKTTAKRIEVEIKNDENKISNNIFDALKGKNIELKINKYDNNNLKYVWYINGKNIEKSFEFDTLVKFESNNKSKIDKLTNYANAIYLDYSYSGKLPRDTKFKVYVGDEYNENDLLNLYHYDVEKDKMILKKEGLPVKNGYVEYNLEHCSEYILTQSTIDNQTTDYKNIIILLESIIIVGASTLLLLMHKKQKQLK